MSKRFFDYECSTGHSFEELAEFEDTPPCPHCGAPGKRLISPVRIDRTRIATTPGASPESIAHFDRIHRQRKAIEERKERDHGPMEYGAAAGSD